MSQVPFTVTSDFELGPRVAPYVVPNGGDVEIIEGAVPEDLASATERGPAYTMAEGRFLLKIPNGIRLLVEAGERITYCRGGNTDNEIALFLTGSAWGALCYQRSLLPLHASGVFTQQGVCAFTGPSGAGKSTIAAGLSKKGFDFFTDDIVILDPNGDDDRVTAFAGQRDLKLWEDALTMTGSAKLGQIRDSLDIPKFYSTPANISGPIKGPMSKLFVLARGKGRPNEPAQEIAPLEGAKSLLVLRNNIYRPRFAEAIWGRQKYFEVLAKMAGKFEIYTFSRVFLPANFDPSLDYVHDWLCQRSGV